MADEQKNQETAGIVKKGAKVLSFGAFGEVIGRIIAAYVSDAVIADDLLAHGVAALFGVIGTINFSRFFPASKNEPDPTENLRKCLQGADKLFIEKLISQQDVMEMRKACFERHKKDVIGV